MKVISIEQKEDKNGNAMKVVTFEGADKVVYVNSKYDSDNYDKVVEGAEFELEVDGNFLKIAGGKKVGGSKSGMMTKVMAEKREGIAHAMDKKEEAIKTASCNRMATDMVVSLIQGRYKDHSDNELKGEWERWRAHFYSGWNDVNVELVAPF